MDANILSGIYIVNANKIKSQGKLSEILSEHIKNKDNKDKIYDRQYRQKE